MKNNLLIIFTLLFVFYSIQYQNFLQAQIDLQPTLKTSEHNTDEKTNFSIKLYSYTPSINLIFYDNDKNTYEYFFNTSPSPFYYGQNLQSYTGFDISYKNIGIRTISKGYTDDTANLGKPDQKSLTTYYYGHQHFFELYYHRISGFYLDEDEDLSPDTSVPHKIRNDLCITEIGLNYYYLIDPDSFSFRAAFNQSEVQKENGGSITLLINPIYSTIEASSSLVDEKYANYFDRKSEFRSGKFFSSTVSVGYLYTFTFLNLYATPSLFFGIGPQYQDYYDSKHYRNIRLLQTQSVKWAFGYNNNRFSLGFDASGTICDTCLEKCSIGNMVTVINIFCGVKF